MKKRILILTGMFFFALSAFSRDIYTIHVRSVSYDKPLTAEEVQAGMWQHKVGDRSKCFLGHFESRNAAEGHLKTLDKSLYPNAFVLSIGEVFSLKIPIKTRDGESVEIKNSDLIQAEKTTIKPDYQGREAPDETYTIQIAACRKALFDKNLDLGKPLMEFYCKDDLYRYCVGKFEDKREALEFLKNVKKKGHSDAFVIDYKKYELYRIE